MEIPPAGPRLPLEAWARVVTDRVRQFLPEVLAMRRGRSVRWSRGSAKALLDASRDEWWLTIRTTSAQHTGLAAVVRHDTAGGFATHSGRHDYFTAEVTASNIVIHFDTRFCRGLAVPPYTEHELAVMRKR
jgi:hypothetical protein